jgi:ketosteroid isomerase-like protein
MRRALTTLTMLAACGGSAPNTAPPPVVAAKPATELSPVLSKLSWWLGDWKGEGGTEHWTAAGGAIYGAAFDHAGQFEVLIVDDDADGNGPADGTLRMIAMPGGTRSVELAHVTGAKDSATFENPDNDPSTITYGRDGAKLSARVEGFGKLTFVFEPIAHVAAPELEQADLAFAAATKQRGVAGWVDAFAPDGWMWRKAGMVERAKIGDTMAPLLGAGRLTWAPIASAIEGELGYTVGTATFTGKTPADGWTSSYITIWKHQPDGSWKVLFDTGRGVNQ